MFLKLFSGLQNEKHVVETFFKITKELLIYVQF